MMKCAQTISGVLMIVGLAYLAGSVQSLVREYPVILGAVDTPPPPTPSTSTDPSTPAPDISGQPPAQQTPGAVNDDAEPGAVGDEDGEKAAPGDAGDAEYQARLDAPVPAGMLTLRQAQQLWIDGAYFVDARLKHEFEEGHVSGAAHLTPETITSKQGRAQMQTIPKDATVVVYCIGGEGCDASKNTMALMQQFGYTDIRIMGVGYDEWAAAGLPTERGDS